MKQERKQVSRKTGLEREEKERRRTICSDLMTIDDFHRLQRQEEDSLVDLSLFRLAEKEVAVVEEGGEVSNLDGREERSVDRVLVDDIERSDEKTFVERLQDGWSERLEQ